MAEVGSLWVGGNLGPVQEICLSSFVHNGHKVFLYVYDMNIKVPKGVIKKNANEILKKDKVFLFHNQYAGFSDVFRYAMISKTGLFWIDADTISFQEYFFEDKSFVFIKEDQNTIAGGILKIPKEHIIIKELLDLSFELIEKNSSSYSLEKFSWVSLGPNLVTKVVNKYDLVSHAQSAESVNVWDFAKESIKCWDPKSTKDMYLKTENAVCGTFFTGGLKMMNFDANQPLPNGSLIKYFYKKYVK
jgi:hypothetical protein